MSRADAAQLGAVLGAVGCPPLLVISRRDMFLLGLGFLAAAEAFLAYSLVPPDDFRLFASSPARLVLVAVAAALVAGAGIALSRWPSVVPVAVLVAAPVRIPVELGEQEAFLLLPLYGVLAAAVLGLVVRLARGEELATVPPALAWPASALAVLAAVSLLWSEDVRNGSIQLFFFLFPFVALVAIVVRSPFQRWLPRALGVALVALGLGFAGVGVWQLWSERLFFARDLEVANAYTAYFRTTSLFADSSLYGRHVVLALVVVIAGLWLGRVHLALGVPVVAALWTGLYFSYSQSSFVALAVAVLALSIVLAGRRERRLIVVGAVVVGLVGAGALAAVVRSHTADRISSGRTGLAERTTRVFLDHPLVGVGIGAHAKASQEQPGARRETRRNVSHTTPLTVAAELGLVGLTAYVAFLTGAARVLADAWRRRPDVGTTLAAAFLALFVHSLFYSGFFEDPIVWGILAVAAASLAPTPQPSAAVEARAGPAPASAVSGSTATASSVPGRWHT